MQINAIKLTEKDNVATVLTAVARGETVCWNAVGDSVCAKADIPFGHKVAVREIAEGETVCKYGEVIGVAVKAITAGEHVHVSNIDSRRARGDLK